MLRARKPEAVVKRLKLFMFGPAGVGKTTAAMQFPQSYIIDGERGCENYDKLIAASGSVVFPTTDINEVVQEVKALLTDKHDFRTLIIDPITPIFNDLLDKCESQVGSDFGRHYGAANKTMKRLANLIMNLDMNVIVTAHAKAEYGANLAKLGYTFDGWKQLDYWFDLVVELGKKGKKRFGRVSKTRIEAFPDEDVFEWSYDAFRKRYDAAILERPATAVSLASPEQIREIRELLAIVRLPDGLVDKWFAKAQVDAWDDMPAQTIAQCIAYVKDRHQAAPAPAAPPQAATPAPAAQAPATASAEQVATIVDLLAKTKTKPAWVAATMARANVKAWAELTPGQAEKVIDSLSLALTQNKPAAA